MLPAYSPQFYSSYFLLLGLLLLRLSPVVDTPAHVKQAIALSSVDISGHANIGIIIEFHHDAISGRQKPSLQNLDWKNGEHLTF